MWIVGDDVIHARYLEALCQGHGYSGRVESYLEGELLEEIVFESGTVQVTGRGRERRSLSGLKVSETLWPSEPTDPLSPYGTWIRCYVTVTAGGTSFPEIPVFAGKVTLADKARWSGAVAVNAVDPMWQVNAQAFEGARQAPAGISISGVILQLLREVFPDATLTDTTGSAATVPSGVVWSFGDGSRGKAIDELAASIGAEVYARPTAVWPGGDFVLRPVASLSDQVVWTLPDGSTSVVEADRMLLRGDTIANRWIVTGERTDQSEPIRAVITDDDPTSPTRYGGPMGRLPRFWSSPTVSSQTQAFDAGRAKLSRSIGLARPRTVTVIANPALDAGDVLAIGVDGETPVYYIADDFAVPLQPDPASMTINARSAGGSE